MLDEQPSPVGSLLSRVTQLSPRIRIVAAASVAIFVTSIVAATISLAGTPDESSVVAAVVEETSTPSPTPPPPTPTPPPPWPWPAERIERGELAADLFNPTSGGFPPPPPAAHTPIVDGPPVVRMVAPSLGINHYITTVSVVDGQMLSPEGDDANYAVGWYPSDDTWTFGNPGEAGNVVFSAHDNTYLKGIDARLLRRHSPPAAHVVHVFAYDPLFFVVPDMLLTERTVFGMNASAAWAGGAIHR